MCLKNILIITDSGEAPAPALRQIRERAGLSFVPLCAKRCRADFRPPLKADFNF